MSLDRERATVEGDRKGSEFSVPGGPPKQESPAYKWDRSLLLDFLPSAALDIRIWTKDIWTAPA